MKSAKDLVIFDFDGVIANTIRADFRQAVNAFLRVGRKIQVTNRVEKQFAHLMRFQRVHSDYYILLSMLAANPSGDFSRITDSDFEEAKMKFGDPKMKNVFVEKFLEERSKMIKEQPELFKRLSFAYRHAVEAVRKARREGYNVAIATTRDADSLKFLLRHLRLRFDDRNVITKEIADDKWLQIRFLANRFRVRLNKIVLIDDMPENLERARNAGAHGILATWGQRVPKRQNWTRERRIPVAKTPKNLQKLIRSTLR